MVVYIAYICNWLRTYFLIVADFFSYIHRLYCWCLASHDASAIRYLFVAFYGAFYGTIYIVNIWFEWIQYSETVVVFKWKNSNIFVFAFLFWAIMKLFLLHNSRHGQGLECIVSIRSLNWILPKYCRRIVSIFKKSVLSLFLDIDKLVTILKCYKKTFITFLNCCKIR